MTLYEVLKEDHRLLFFVSLSCWFVLYHLCHIILSTHRRSKSISPLIRTYMAESCVSSVQGFVCGGIGVYGVLCCKHDVMNAQSELVVLYCTIGAGYFVYDVIAMFCSNYRMLEATGKQLTVYYVLKKYLRNHWLMVTHHIILVAFLFPALITYSGIGHFFAGCFFCMELSSPLVNARVVLSKLEMKHTTIYVVNGVTMMIVFAFCRVFIFPYMYITYCLQTASMKSISIVEALMRVPTVCHTCCGLILMPQLYWLSLMVRGVAAVIARQPKIIDKLD